MAGSFVPSDTGPQRLIDLFPLTAILDEEASARAGWAIPDLARAFVAGGARLIQLRAKRASGARFLEMASAVVEIARPAGARVLVNDRADIALLSSADGVHVGQDDLPPDAARAVLGERAIIGLSTHTAAQLQAALRSPIDYVAIGPVFPTATKDTGCEAVGLQGVAAAARLCAAHARPLVAIGGITIETAAAVIAAGATSVAVIADLLAGGDPEARVRAYLSRL